MSRLDEFLRLLCGRFDNTRQLEELRRMDCTTPFP